MSDLILTYADVNNEKWCSECAAKFPDRLGHSTWPMPDGAHFHCEHCGRPMYPNGDPFSVGLPA